MFSLFSMALSAVISFFLYILKGLFSMLAWFLKNLFRLIKLFFCALPITSALFIVFFLTSIFLFFSGMRIVSVNTDIFQKLLSDIRIWWVLTIYPTRGSMTFVLLIILSAILFIPVIFSIFCIGTVISFGKFLFYGALADAIIYLVRAIFQKSFIAQFQGRYYLLFPSAGKRHYEKKYEKWLRKHHEDFEDESESPRKSARDFYEEDDETYDDDYYEDDESYEDENFYEDDESYENEDFYEDDEPYEDGDFYEDDEPYDDENFCEDDESYEDENFCKGQKSAFNFFAGCSSRESVDKKYRSLVKLYHPDNMDGDTKALQEINVQYSEAKKRFG